MDLAEPLHTTHSMSALRGHDDGRGTGGVVLVPLDEGAHLLRRDQPCPVTLGAWLPGLMVSAAGPSTTTGIRV
jgi:hypothetical protein